jgi:hypothetical protein
MQIIKIKWLRKRRIKAKTKAEPLLSHYQWSITLFGQ